MHPPMPPTLHKATSQEEREAVYRLRYATYVSEMQLFGTAADHIGRRLTDPLDASAHLVYATSDEEVVGTVRLHVGEREPFPDRFERLYGLSRFADCVQGSEIVILSMLTTRADYRESDLALDLLREAARIACVEGGQLVFVAPQPHLLNLYLSLGFRSYGSRVFNDPELGILVPMALVTADREHLEEVRSPLGPVFRDASRDKARVKRILERLGAAGVQSLDESGPNGWTTVYARLADARQQGPRFFDGLNAEEIRTVVSHGHVITCRPGDRLIRKGQRASNVMVVLSGSLEVREGDRILAVAVPGDAVGELAFLLGERRTADVFAGRAGVEVLNLDEKVLNNLIENPTRISGILLFNLSRTLARKLAETTALLQPPGKRLFQAGGLF